MTMGWTWDYTANEVDLLMLGAMQRVWEKHPPVHRMIEAYLGFGETSKEYVPSPDDPAVESLPKHEFESMLEKFGLSPK